MNLSGAKHACKWSRLSFKLFCFSILQTAFSLLKGQCYVRKIVFHCCAQHTVKEFPHQKPLDRHISTLEINLNATPPLQTYVLLYTVDQRGSKASGLHLKECPMKNDHFKVNFEADIAVSLGVTV